MSPDLGEHRVVRELARGGMGVLYEVEHRPTGARRALKTLLLGAHDPEERARFRREAQLLARLDHPAIVRIHEAVVDGPAPYLVQDLLPGGSLEDRLAKGPLPCAEARAIAAALARGVEHAHARGVLHRDLKPRNVVFDDQGRPRLVDFGLARRVDGGSLTATGTILGTPGYLSPEQANGLVADERSDVYGLGAVLYAMLVGRPPVEGTHALAVLAAVVEGRLVPPRALRADVPPDLEAICLRALATAPGARFPTAAGLAAALEGRAPVAPARRSRAAPAALAAGLLALGLGTAALLRPGRAPVAQPPATPARPSSPPPSSPPPTPPPTTEPPPPPAGPETDPVELLVRCEPGSAVAGLSSCASGDTLVGLERVTLDTLAHAIDARGELTSNVLGRAALRLLKLLAPIEELALRHDDWAEGRQPRPPELGDDVKALLGKAEALLAALKDLERDGRDVRSRWREVLRRRTQRTLGRALSAQALTRIRDEREAILAWSELHVAPLGPERHHLDVLWAYEHPDERAEVPRRVAPVEALAGIHRQAAHVALLLVRASPLDASGGDALLARLENLALDNGSRLVIVRREVGRLHRLAAWRARRLLPAGAAEPDEVPRELATAVALCTKRGKEASGLEGAELLLCQLARRDLAAAEHLLERLRGVASGHVGLLRAELLLARRTEADARAARELLEALPDTAQERRTQLAHALRLLGDPAWEAPLEGAEGLPPWGIEWRGLEDARAVALDQRWWPGRRP